MYEEYEDESKRALDSVRLDIEELESKIRAGESQTQDFKFRIDSSPKIAKTLSAFANTDGGYLLIGVKDNGRIAGIDPQEEYYMIEGAAALYCRPEVPFEWEVFEDEEGHRVLQVYIPASADRPHYAKNEDGKWLAYIRQEDENYLANRVLIRYMKDKSSQIRKSHIAYTDDERRLFELMELEDGISLSRYAKYAKLPHHKAERILATFLKWNLISARASEQGIRFYRS